MYQYIKWHVPLKSSHLDHDQDGSFEWEIKVFYLIICVFYSGLEPLSIVSEGGRGISWLICNPIERIDELTHYWSNKANIGGICVLHELPAVEQKPTIMNELPHGTLIHYICDITIWEKKITIAHSANHTTTFIKLNYIRPLYPRLISCRLLFVFVHNVTNIEKLLTTNYNINYTQKICNQNSALKYHT